MSRIASILLAVGMLTDAHPLHASDWTPIAPLPGARLGAAAATAAGTTFVLGGFDTQPLASVASWDGSSWAGAPPMLEQRQWPAATAAGGIVFALGGLDIEGVAKASVERLGAGGWGEVAPMPGGRAMPAAGTVGGIVYVAGGRDESSRPAADCFRYDPVANAWTSVAPMSAARYGAAAAVLGGRIWMLGGFGTQPVATVERFDPATGAWSGGPDLPEPLWLASAATAGDRVWVAGGLDASSQASARVYSAGADGLWRPEASLPAPLAASAMATRDGCLLLAGGSGAAGLPEAAAYSMFPAEPPPPGDTLRVEVRITPATLGTGSQGRWVGVRIQPDGWAPHDIEIGSLTLDGVRSDPGGPVSYDVSDAGRAELNLKFPRAPFSSRAPGTYDLVLLGRRLDDRPLRGVAGLTVNAGGHALSAMRTSDGRTGVVVALDRPEDATLDVVDLQGRVVARIANGRFAAGASTREWPRAGETVARGSYFVRLRRAGSVDVVKLSVVR